MACYHDHPGLRTTETSQQAAAFMSGVLLTYGTILEMRMLGLTAHETAVEMALDMATIRSHLSVLRRKGLITDSGLRRRTTRGKLAIVWIAVAALADG